MSRIHPLAIFALLPLNERAERVVDLPENSPFRTTLSNGKLALDVGHIRSKSDHTTIATLGRGDADIVVDGGSIAKIQCSFELDPATGVVMLYDRSHGQSTQVYGRISMPFEHGRVRKVAVRGELNEIIGMGGVRRDLVMFQLRWHQAPEEVIKQIRCRANGTQTLEDHPRLARTVIDEADTALTSRRETRIHTPGSGQMKMRCFRMDPLGAGQFGTVFRALDVDSGKLMAVKVLRSRGVTQQDQIKWNLERSLALKREVELFARLSHPHIVEYIYSQGWDEMEVEIFMSLKDGNLETLINNGASPAPEKIFHQMLQALDYLASCDLIHRDVKPANILWEARLEGQYHFLLGDFGACNRGVSAYTFAGSEFFMAPEIGRRQRQTTKADIWSLFVTMLWVLNVNGFRQNSLFIKNVEQLLAIILEISQDASVSSIRSMVEIDPAKRPSAANLLLACFQGEGIVSRNRTSDRISPVVESTENTPSSAPGPARRNVQRGRQNMTIGEAAHRNQNAQFPYAKRLGRRVTPYPGAGESSSHGFGSIIRRQRRPPGFS